MPHSRSEVYTHGHQASVLRSHTWRTASNSAAYLLPSLKPHMKILDVGCGPGTITVDFANLVPQGQVTGIDSAEEVLIKARVYAAAQGVENIAFIAGDAYSLPFPDASFDVTHCHQVLQHVGDPVQVLREMRRVTKSGGILAAREADFSAMSWYPLSEGMNQWKETYQRVARGNGGEPDAGRRIHVWAREAGFNAAAIVCSAGTWCFQTREDRDWWGGLWADRVIDSNFAASAINNQHASQEDLQCISQAWRNWASDENGWFVVIHGEVICKV